MKIQDIVTFDEKCCQNPEELCADIDMLDDPRVRIGAVMGFLGRKQKSKMDREMENVGLTGKQIEVLFYIIKCCQKNKIITAKDLEIHFRVKNPTMSGILKRLERKDLIERIIDKEDRRNKQIRIKGDFDGLCRGIEGRIQEEFDLMFRDFSADEVDRLLQLLIKLLHNIE